MQWLDDAIDFDEARRKRPDSNASRSAGSRGIMIERFVLRAEALHLLIDAFAESFEADAEVVHAARGAQRNDAGRLELQVADFFHRRRNALRRQAAEDRGRALLRQRMQTEGCLRDHA